MVMGLFYLSYLCYGCLVSLYMVEYRCNKTAVSVTRFIYFGNAPLGTVSVTTPRPHRCATSHPDNVTYTRTKWLIYCCLKQTLAQLRLKHKTAITTFRMGGYKIQKLNIFAIQRRNLLYSIKIYGVICCCIVVVRLGSFRRNRQGISDKTTYIFHLNDVPYFL